jgi:hypothetical protein
MLRKQAILHQWLHCFTQDLLACAVAIAIPRKLVSQGWFGFAPPKYLEVDMRPFIVFRGLCMLFNAAWTL